MAAYSPMDSQSSQSSYDSGKRRLSSQPSMPVGKLPPQALDMEEAVLGALMLEKDALHRIMDILKPHMFF